MAELTYEELQKNGIDTSQIAVCKRIRNIAKLDRVKLGLQHKNQSEKQLG